MKRGEMDENTGQPAKRRSNPGEMFAQYFTRKCGVTVNPARPVLQCPLAGRTKSGRLLLYPADVLRLSTLRAEQLTKLPTLCSLYPEERMQRVKVALARIAASKLMKTMLAQTIVARGEVLRAPCIYAPAAQNHYNVILAVEYPGQAHRIHKTSDGWTTPIAGIPPPPSPPSRWLRGGRRGLAGADAWAFFWP
ncbi:argonaute-like protein (AGO1) [Leptomonas seymouri]|uniref:Argonaute-like protein (AGO1) n=1 Tax=Leptomonas seymouri TaxID=5684 RepID=A0A0N0P487_LEPSE|nr:argonaute-like protein (AGO1) [Leptomonas seymouri]|eukprot:KPI85009.1 argonaute-like protein (AGO1) [Leptomonas seymouri]